MARVQSEDHFGDVTADLEARKRAGLKAGAEVLQSEARELTPKESGALAASLQIAMGDDGAAVYSHLPYAARQHEAVGYRHTNGQAKFLETALAANQPAIEQAIAEQLRLD